MLTMQIWFFNSPTYCKQWANCYNYKNKTGFVILLLFFHILCLSKSNIWNVDLIIPLTQRLQNGKQGKKSAFLKFIGLCQWLLKKLQWLWLYQKSSPFFKGLPAKAPSKKGPAPVSRLLRVFIMSFTGSL